MNNKYENIIQKITRIKFMNISLVAQSNEDLSTFDQQRETKRGDEQETQSGEGLSLIHI